MMTPQEVASHSFAKATLGGYNLAQVDEFLDALTEDYTALYNENAILKNKLKVLSETVEEYRATEETMRKTLLAAQKMADDLVGEAKKKQAQLMGDAEKDARRRVKELEKSVAAEEYRLKQAQQETASFVEKVRALHAKEAEYLASKIQYGKLVPLWLLALICLLAYGSLMLWVGFRIDTGRDMPLAAVLHMPSGWLISGLCLVAGVFCGGVAAKEFAEAEKGWWKEGITAFGFMTVSVMLCIYLIR